MKYSVRDMVEYGFVRTVQTLLGLLPLRLAFAFAWVVMKGVFWLGFGKKRRLVAERVREVFGAEVPEAEVNRIAWLSLRNMAFNMIEMMRANRFDRAWVDRNMPDFGPQIPRVIGLIEKFGGAVITVPHFGNWDLAAIACRTYDIKMIAISARQRNPLLNAWINRTRTHGTQIVERNTPSSLRRVTEFLRTGGAVAILADISMKHHGVSVDFLGGKANIGEGIGRFAYTSNVPVVYAAPHRVGWTKFHFEVLGVAHPDLQAPEEDEVKRIAQEVMSGFDKAIRNDPGQWFWFNKRWILSPPKEKRHDSRQRALR